LYFFLGGCLIAGSGVGALSPFRNLKSLAVYLPRFQKRLALISILCLAAFVILVSWRMIFSNLVLEH
ncbi:MAG TPA: hypothetical protein VLS90_19215, partial [Thermodesulfobacteriota bacterium]|nr:hypothetical protein [Thermodesulfobacteriota bacterium]